MSVDGTPRPPASLLGEASLAVARLHGRLLSAHERMARASGLTAARWQVLETVAEGPRTVSDVARHLGTRRQSVQRIADALVDAGVAEYRPNPAHSRARLLAPTEAGHEALRGPDPQRARMAEALLAELGEEELRHTLARLHTLSEAVDRWEER
ncbi:winged helix-turn-helix transcriptional regulator [Nocardiopsis sp. HNM0947]|uniref:Winged helix-turn-helix transcriptional regulator n=1 Tax=Nocardiopsis coralli TaxID=2772213 RepID=A0ABR9P7W8_9ACTN|nr:MarR family winged helix-turn-helix transcriptional regulator [Nocardiopsis coralli]MBE2999931.1 winged helix-turn-helix transcriptional regulator [Nocardiopsis coralli]